MNKEYEEFNSTLLSYIDFIIKKQPDNIKLKLKRSQFIMAKNSTPQIPLIMCGKFLTIHQKKLVSVDSLDEFFIADDLQLNKLGVTTDVTEYITDARAIYYMLSVKEQEELLEILKKLLNIYKKVQPQ